MNLDEIKEIIENDGGKLIIVENGKPSMVIMGFEDYKNKIKKNGNNEAFRKNKEVNVKADIKEEFPILTDSADPNEEISINDLPLE